MTTMQEILYEIDPAMESVECLKEGFLRVQKVRKNGTDYILKITHKDNDSYIQKELEALTMAKDVSGITHLVKDYGTINEYTSILKEYFAGQDLNTLRTNISDSSQQRKLEKTIRNLHSLGMADLDITRKDIVLSKNSEAMIIDLDRYVSRQECGSLEEFEKLKQIDYKNLGGCFI